MLNCSLKLCLKNFVQVLSLCQNTNIQAGWTSSLNKITGNVNEFRNSTVNLTRLLSFLKITQKFC